MPLDKYISIKLRILNCIKSGDVIKLLIHFNEIWQLTVYDENIQIVNQT